MHWKEKYRVEYKTFSASALSKLTSIKINALRLINADNNESMYNVAKSIIAYITEIDTNAYNEEKMIEVIRLFKDEAYDQFKKQSIEIVEIIAPRNGLLCAHCGHVFDKPATRKRKCPNCKNDLIAFILTPVYKIYITPDEEKRILDIQTTKIDVPNSIIEFTNSLQLFIFKRKFYESLEQLAKAGQKHFKLGAFACDNEKRRQQFDGKKYMIQEYLKSPCFPCADCTNYSCFPEIDL